MIGSFAEKEKILRRGFGYTAGNTLEERPKATVFFFLEGGGQLWGRAKLRIAEEEEKRRHRPPSLRVESWKQWTQEGVGASLIGRRSR